MTSFKFKTEKLALLLGIGTIGLFAFHPFILDLIVPSKSIGRILGENAKDLLEALDGERNLENPKNSRRKIWSNAFHILGFVFFGLTLFISADLLKSKSKWYGIAAISLAVIGLVFFFYSLAIGFIAFVVIAILVCLLAVTGGVS